MTTANGDGGLVEELASVLGGHRPHADAEALARRVLGQEGHRRAVVGLTDGGYRAAYYEFAARVVRVEPVTTGEVDVLAEVETVAVGGRPADREWVRERGREHWDWLHPQYRWVFGADADGGGVADT